MEYNYANRYGGDSPDSLVIIEAISRIAQALERIADKLEKEDRDNETQEGND